MTLDQWLRQTGTKEEAFASAVGTTQGTVNKWRHALRYPRPATILRIAQITRGAVGPADWLPATEEVAP